MAQHKQYRHIYLRIDACEYEISLYLSVGDIISLIKSENTSTEEQKLLIASILINHIVASKSVPTKEFVAERNHVLSAYIQELLEDDPKLQQAYEKHLDVHDEYLRFVLSAKEMWSELSRSVLSKLPSNPKLLSADISNATSALFSSIGHVISASERIAKYSISKINTFYSAIQQVMEPLNLIAQLIGEFKKAFAVHLSPIFDLIKIPKISEERKKELLIIFDKWGRTGWTLMPHADFSIFNEAPSTIKEANEKAKSWCSKENVIALFDALHYVKGVNIKDLDTAITLYSSRQYKPCAMLLFSLLDAKLIRMQKKEDINRRTNRRDSGSGAIRNIKKRVESELDVNKKFFLMLSCANLFSCLETFFENANDFKNQPVLINRNFLQHGMLTRPVKKRECIQLFLLYYNFLEFFEPVND